MKFHIYLRPEPEGGFTVIVPSLPGCVTWGKDLAEARAMAADAIGAYLESLEEHGEPLPPDDQGLVDSVEVQVGHG